MEIETIQKTPFYKRKMLIVPLVVILSMAFILAAVNYFYSIQVDLTINEARSSADIPFSLSIYSGETQTRDLTIHNSANVQLCAELSWEEVNNTDNVSYTNNLPIQVALAPLEDTNITTSFTADELSETGSVTGNILYSKIACP